MNFAYWLDAWIYRTWYKKCILEICRINPASSADRENIKKKTLEIIEENGIPMSFADMEFFTEMEKPVVWGF